MGDNSNGLAFITSQLREQDKAIKRFNCGIRNGAIDQQKTQAINALYERVQSIMALHEQLKAKQARIDKAKADGVRVRAADGDSSRR